MKSRNGAPSEIWTLEGNPDITFYSEADAVNDVDDRHEGSVTIQRYELAEEGWVEPEYVVHMDKQETPTKGKTK